MLLNVWLRLVLVVLLFCVWFCVLMIIFSECSRCVVDVVCGLLVCIVVSSVCIVGLFRLRYRCDGVCVMIWVVNCCVSCSVVIDMCLLFLLFFRWCFSLVLWLGIIIIGSLDGLKCVGSNCLLLFRWVCS